MSTTKIRRGLLAAVAALAVPLSAIAPVRVPVAAAASNATPSFEVKLNLAPGALDGSGAPNADVRTTFGLGGTAKALAYEYFDTAPLELNSAGWSVRLRHKDGSSFDLNYKKRFPVTGEDLDAALTEANAQGFDSSDTNYDAQVDWTSDKMTLSFANKKSAAAKGYQGTALPAEPAARELLLDQLPGKLRNWSGSNWGRTTLADSRQHGPVQARTWSGRWQGVDLDLEVVPVRAATGEGTETIIELSFKTDGSAQARDLRDKAIGTLRARGWLAPAAVLKTDLILRRY
ncbi:hypothetical protein F5X71_22210 [Nocardia brasiliensis]|uniref:CYTH domain-containing protein n=1 Tax=Nocardia brasiliensis TaxID=37326 RepID=A0A6G9XV05_NOCBR|nr:hypothetical protein [Nocardia brasiliensis]QIS04680.1 hypothetical protein F5X71_22210 [Nocardia brasiliensis]